MQIWCAQGSKTQIQEPRAIKKPRMGGAAQAMLGHAGWANGTEEQLGRFLVMSCLINSILFFPERDPVRPCNLNTVVIRGLLLTQGPFFECCRVLFVLGSWFVSFCCSDQRFLKNLGKCTQFYIRLRHHVNYIYTQSFSSSCFEFAGKNGVWN